MSDTYGPEFGYTLADGRLFCDFAAFQEWASDLIGRPLMTHEFYDRVTWDELRSIFEERVRVAAEDRAATVHLYGEERVEELEKEANRG